MERTLIVNPVLYISWKKQKPNKGNQTGFCMSNWPFLGGSITSSSLTLDLHPMPYMYELFMDYLWAGARQNDAGFHRWF